MVLEFVLGFVVLVAASYVGTTIALRGFFGRERYVPDFERSGESPNDDGSLDADQSNRGNESNGTKD